MQQIRTIGHGLRPFTDFIDILHFVSFDYLVDVRSLPRSRRNPPFNRSNLESVFGNQYLWLPSLGGFDENISEAEFQKGIEEVVTLSQQGNVVVMCSEKDYKRCHRHSKLEPEFRLQGFLITHL